MNEYKCLMCNVEVLVWSITKCRNYRVTELRRISIWDILGHLYSTEDYAAAYIVTLWGLSCVDEYVRATVWERRCDQRRCEKDVVRAMLWDRRFGKTLWENHFFLLTKLIFVSKNVLSRLGALHLWCLCFIQCVSVTIFRLLLEAWKFRSDESHHQSRIHRQVWNGCRFQTRQRWVVLSLPVKYKLTYPRSVVGEPSKSGPAVTRMGGVGELWRLLTFLSPVKTSLSRLI